MFFVMDFTVKEVCYNHAWNYVFTSLELQFCPLIMGYRQWLELCLFVSSNNKILNEKEYKVKLFSSLLPS